MAGVVVVLTEEKAILNYHVDGFFTHTRDFKL
jgi:hypothetical protein